MKTKEFPRKIPFNLQLFQEQLSEKKPKVQANKYKTNQEQDALYLKWNFYRFPRNPESINHDLQL